jgi:hypothetical protein
VCLIILAFGKVRKQLKTIWTVNKSSKLQIEHSGQQAPIHIIIIGNDHNNYMKEA